MMTCLPDPQGLSEILLVSGGWWWMTVPDDVTITIASTEPGVCSPASADTLAHPCHAAQPGLNIFSEIKTNFGPWSWEQSRQGSSSSEGKDTSAEIPRKWWHGHWGQSWPENINKDLQKSPTADVKRVYRYLSGGNSEKKGWGNVGPPQILMMTLCAWHWSWWGWRGCVSSWVWAARPDIETETSTLIGPVEQILSSDWPVGRFSCFCLGLWFVSFTRLQRSINVSL